MLLKNYEKLIILENENYYQSFWILRRETKEDESIFLKLFKIFKNKNVRTRIGLGTKVRIRT